MLICSRSVASLMRWVWLSLRNLASKSLRSFSKISNWRERLSRGKNLQIYIWAANLFSLLNFFPLGNPRPPKIEGLDHFKDKKAMFS